VAAVLENDPVAAVFRFRENPFVGRFQTTLHPKTVEDLGGIYAAVDGLRAGQDRIERWVEGIATRRERPLVALVSGPRGSGRGSVARYLAYKCASTLRAPTQPSVTPGDVLAQHLIETRVADEHYIAPVADLIDQFFQHLSKLGIAAPEKAHELWLDSMKQPAFPPPRYYRALYTTVRVSNKLPLPLPIFCCKDVRNYRQIATIAEVCGGDAVLVFTTTLETVSKTFLEEVDRGRFDALYLHLNKLTSEDVMDLVQQRWRTFSEASSELALPLSSEQITLAFRVPWPIKGVILMLAAIFAEHASRHGEGHAAQTPDPLTADEMMQCILRVVSERGGDFV
jgi:hypothetical protein